MSLPEIEHGTVRGWRQHIRRKVPACDACIEARRVDNEQRFEKSQDGPGFVSDAQAAWYGGKFVRERRVKAAPRVDADDQRQAALVVASQARDADDCRMLLEMIGLIPAGTGGGS